MKSYITKDPNILGGKPVISGTRIPVERLIYLLKEGYTIENIAEQYPHVDIKTIDKVIDEIVEKINSFENAPQAI